VEDNLWQSEGFAHGMFLAAMSENDLEALETYVELALKFQPQEQVEKVYNQARNRHPQMPEFNEVVQDQPQQEKSFRQAQLENLQKANSNDDQSDRPSQMIEVGQSSVTTTPEILAFGTLVTNLVWAGVVSIFGLGLLYLSVFTLWRMDNTPWAFAAIPAGFFGMLFLTRGIRWAYPLCDAIADLYAGRRTGLLLITAFLLLVGLGFLYAVFFIGDTSTWGAVLVKVFAASCGMVWLGDALKLWLPGLRAMDRRTRGVA
jgi:hypothetical protein